MNITDRPSPGGWAGCVSRLAGTNSVSCSETLRRSRPFLGWTSFCLILLSTVVGTTFIVYQVQIESLYSGSLWRPCRTTKLYSESSSARRCIKLQMNRSSGEAALPHSFQCMEMFLHQECPDVRAAFKQVKLITSIVHPSTTRAIYYSQSTRL